MIAAIGLALAAPPTRAFMLEWVAGIAAVEPGPPLDPTAPQVSSRVPPPALSRPRSGSVRFTPASDSVSIRFDGALPPDHIRLRRGDAAEVVLRAHVSDGPLPPLLIQPSGIDVRNSGTPAARFELELPASVRLATISIRGEPPRRVSPGVDP